MTDNTAAATAADIDAIRRAITPRIKWTDLPAAANPPPPGRYVASFTAHDPAAIAAAAARIDRYPMDLTAPDAATVLTALSMLAQSDASETETDRAHSLYAAMLDTLDIEVI